MQQGQIIIDNKPMCHIHAQNRLYKTIRTIFVKTGSQDLSFLQRHWVHMVQEPGASQDKPPGNETKGELGGDGKD